ncbi:MAG: flagellar biosynthesis anti-sigma factor FlgM [Spirochaetaceae bacterium]|jgi:negative regulator of flagellin synthesis FlgM|nr:flagellar biosynthesis anti-sigma factor FlgM [Spirochaetaceae bacterium]
MMSVGRVNPLEQVFSGNGKANPTVKSTKGDSVSISSEAVEKAERLRVAEMVAVAPDVRADKIADLKERINNPSYMNEAVIRETAEKILDALFPDSDSSITL